MSWIKEKRFELTLIGLVLAGLAVALVCLAVVDRPGSSIRVPEVVSLHDTPNDGVDDPLTFALIDRKRSLYIERHSGCLYQRDPARDLLTLHREGGDPVCDIDLIPRAS